MPSSCAVSVVASRRRGPSVSWLPLACCCCCWWWFWGIVSCAAVTAVGGGGSIAEPATAAATEPIVIAPWSWDTISTFVHCSNKSGPLNGDILELMGRSSFTVIEKYMCLECAPNSTGAEEKVLAAAKQIRAANPGAPIIFYFAVDYTRRWYDLGVYFDEHPELEVHNQDGSLAEVENNDDGHWTWHVFDFAKAAAVQKWVSDIASVVRRGNLQGVFIDGYRGTGDISWAKGLIKKADVAEQQAWVENAWGQTGAQLKASLPQDSVMLPNGNELDSPPPGYNSISIEFFSVKQIPLLRSLARNRTFVEVHAYIGDNRALYNLTLAAYLVAVGENAYFGAGNTWDTCESWLVDYQMEDFQRKLGAPFSEATTNQSVLGLTYSRRFASSTNVSLTIPTGSDCGKNPHHKRCSSCIWWGDGSTTGNACDRKPWTAYSLKSDDPSANFWQITDVHLNPAYPSGCGACKAGPSHDPCGKFADYYCGSSPALFSSAMEFMGRTAQQKPPSFIAHTGDFPDVWNAHNMQNHSYFLDNVRFQAKSLQSTFPSTPIFYAFGNHDFPATTGCPYLPGCHSHYEKMCDIFGAHMDANASASCRATGYYFVDNQVRGVRVIVLNTEFFNWEGGVDLDNPVDSAAADAHLVWLRSALQTTPHKAMIMGHIPPTSSIPASEEGYTTGTMPGHAAPGVPPVLHKFHKQNSELTDNCLGTPEQTKAANNTHDAGTTVVAEPH